MRKYLYPTASSSKFNIHEFFTLFGHGICVIFFLQSFYFQIIFTIQLYNYLIYLYKCLTSSYDPFSVRFYFLRLFLSLLPYVFIFRRLFSLSISFLLSLFLIFFSHVFMFPQTLFVSLITFLFDDLYKYSCPIYKYLSQRYIHLCHLYIYRVHNTSTWVGLKYMTTPKSIFLSKTKS